MRRQPVERHPGITLRTWTTSGKTQRRFDASYRGPDHREHSRTFTKLGDAERWLRDQRGRADRGEWVDPTAGNRRLGDYALEWLETASLAPNTKRRYRSLLRVHVLPAFGRHPINGIRPSDMRQFVAALSAKGLAPKTVRHAYTLLVGILGVAVEDGLISRVPKPPRERGRRGILPPVPKSLHNYKTHEEIARLAATIPPRYRALIYLGAYGALRYGELAALRVEHVKLRRIEVVETLDNNEPKWGSSGSVPIPAFVAEELARHLSAFPLGPEGLVFTAPEGGPLHYPNFYRRHWRPAVEQAKLAPMTPHDLRHSAVALAIEAGAHPRAIQELCRHSSFNTTMSIYGGLFPDLAEKLAEELDAKARAAARAGSVRDETSVAEVVELRSSP
jgi:integrase